MATDEEKGLLAGTNLHPADIVVIILYFVIVLGFGVWSSLRNRGSVGGYFLAGRSMHWIPVGASLFASNIGSGHFIGLAGSGAATGIGIACFELNAMFILLILGWIFVPVYVAAGVFTMPEYLRKRFGGQRIRIYLSVLAIILSIFTKVAADLFAGATFIEQALSWDLYASIVLLIGIAALFTIAGGLTAVIWTDFIQTIIMLIGAAVLMFKGFITIGGYEMVKYKFMRAVPNTTLYADPPTECGRPPENSFHFFRSVDDPVYPWTGAVFGVTISSVWYWCSDQVIVQRTLAAKNLSHAKAGTILAGYLKVLPMWLLVLPGMMARILFPDTVGCSEPAECLEVCGTAAGCTNIAYPMLVLKLMPNGARGMMLAVMIAALMSSLTSIFNSSSTIFTMDIWRRIHKDANDVELMIVGRVFVLAMVGIGIAWIPIVKNFSELFVYIQSITSYLAPPICAVYVLAVLWKRTNEQGAFWSLMIGLVVGLIRFIWEFSYTVPGCGQGEDTRPDLITKVHFLHFGIILFAITFISCVIISILTPPIDDKYLHRLTYWDRHSKERRVDIDQEELDKRRETAKNQHHGVDNQGCEVERENTAPSTDGLEEGAEEKLPCWKRSLQWICGIEKHEELEMTDEQKRALEEKQTSLYEEPKWRRVVDANAITMMFVAIFIWGFFY